MVRSANDQVLNTPRNWSQIQLPRGSSIASPSKASEWIFGNLLRNPVRGGKFCIDRLTASRLTSWMIGTALHQLQLLNSTEPPFFANVLGELYHLLHLCRRCRRPLTVKTMQTENRCMTCGVKPYPLYQTCNWRWRSVLILKCGDAKLTHLKSGFDGLEVQPHVAATHFCCSPNN